MLIGGSAKAVLFNAAIVNDIELEIDGGNAGIALRLAPIILRRQRGVSSAIPFGLSTGRETDFLQRKCSRIGSCYVQFVVMS